MNARRGERRDVSKVDREQCGPSRRGFVIGTAAVVVGVAAGAVAAPLEAEADVLRPPGSLAEGDFMARCIRC